jgi:hypothetical protein
VDSLGVRWRKLCPIRKVYRHRCTHPRIVMIALIKGEEDETCKILAHGLDLSGSRGEPEFLRDRWRHMIKAQFVTAEAVNVLRFIG